MKTLQNEALLAAMRWRYAVKKFDATKKISPEDWNPLQQALILSPSSYGLQPWKFILVQDPAVRKKLTPLSWNQTQVEDCSHFLVFAGLMSVDEAYIQKFIDYAGKITGAPKEALAGYQKMMVGDLVKGPRSQVIENWATNQAYIALGNSMTAAAVLGIDACPMEGINPPEYDKVLGLEGSRYRTRVACAFGYRHSEDSYAKRPKIRFEENELIQVI